MRASSRLAQLAACAAALSAAGCGASGGPPPTPHVNVAISAPTSGATVGVHKVTITGIVTPAGAQVVVNGQPAKVTGSSFTGTLYVAAANQKIVVNAAAHGYVGSQTSATVSYSPNVAHQLVASAAAANPPVGSTAPKVTTSVLTQAFGLSVASLAKSTHTTPGTGSSPASGSNTPAPGNSGSSSSTGSGGSTSSTGNNSPPSSGASPTSTPPSTSPAPPPTPAQISAAIRDAWVHGCVRVSTGGSVVAYCTCTYNHLAGELQTRASTEHVLKEMVAYLRTGDFRTLPAFIRRAVDACASKLPPLDPVTGKTVLSALPGGAHGATPASNQGNQSGSSAAPAPPAPVPPAPAPPTPVPPTPAVPVANLRSAFQQFNSALTVDRPAAATSAHARSVSETDGRAAGAGLAPQSGHQRLHEARTVAKALSYALVWVGNHDRSGPYPYWYRVKRRLDRHLSAALKFTA